MTSIKQAPYQWDITVAVDKLPTRVASDDELHYLAAYYTLHNTEGLGFPDPLVLMGIAITPSGRIALDGLMFDNSGDETVTLPPLLTPINTLRSDGLFRVISGYYSGYEVANPAVLSRSISYAGVPIVSRYYDTHGQLAGGWNPSKLPLGDERLILMNGPVGDTQAGVRVSRFVVATGDVNGYGALIYDIPYPLPSILVPTTNTAGFNFDLQVQFVQDLVGTPYGQIPVGGPETQIVGWSKTPYIPRNPTNPNYTPVPR